MVKPLDRDEYQRRANKVARQFVTLEDCEECASPTIRGYCCTYCGGGD
jgi:ribosomal protein L32